MITQKILLVIKDATFNSPRVIEFNKNHDEWIYDFKQSNEVGTGIEVDTQDRKYLKKDIKKEKSTLLLDGKRLMDIELI